MSKIACYGYLMIIPWLAITPDLPINYLFKMIKIIYNFL